MKARPFLLAGSALLVTPVHAIAQQAPPPAQSEAEAAPSADEPEQELFDEDESQTIVVTGAKPRGSAIGDIPPEQTLDPRDVRATGATDVNELLEALAPQVGSARGRGGERPITLLNGQRISSFRELRDIPTEAISRVEILPEEVALKYGYRADQKVVNIVLRERFRSTVAELEGKLGTEGGYGGGEADLTRLMIGSDSRTTLDFEVEANSALTEDERDVAAGPGDTPDSQAARTLIGSRRQSRATATHSRRIGTVAATGNIELQRNVGRSLIGLGDTLLEPLARNSATDSAHAGAAFNGNFSDWRWSVTGNADASGTTTRTDRDEPGARDQGKTRTLSADVDAMANGNLFRMPAGEAGATVRVGASTLDLDSERRRGIVETSASLGRTRGFGAINLDVPLSKRNSDSDIAGNLTLNANAEVEQLSDFGTLSVLGAGLNWSPVPRLNLISSWTREEGAPSVNQLGDPLLETPDTRIFDFTTGETVLTTLVTGGNPELQADSRTVLKLGGNWRPLSETELTLRADYVRTRIDRPVSTFPGPTSAIEKAFPERFVRNPDGSLASVDLRPVNFDNGRRDTLRLGFDFSKPLRSARPSQAAIDALRARRGAPPDASPAGEAGRDGGMRGMGGFGRFGGGGRGGRLTFSITDTITLIDDVTIRDGLPRLDYLDGDAVGQSGGRPRHQVEARAGYFNNGLGARLSANWRSGTHVNSASGDQLRFSPLATLDLRLWANVGQRLDLVAKHPWLRGTSVRLEVNNLFDSKPKVRNLAGDVPFGYQPDLLDPLGRTIGISIRKLFLPPRGSFRRDRGEGEGGRGGGEE